MIFLAVLAAGLAAVPALGGRFALLAELRIRAAWLVLAALLLQVLTISVLVQPPRALAAVLHLSSYVLAAGFLWANRGLRGVPLVAGGAALNVLAITANGGVMPARAAALRSAGIAPDGQHFANSTSLTRPRLSLLGDVFAVPQSAGLLANVFSVGDVLLALGAVWLLHSAAGCRWAAAVPVPLPA